MKLNRRNVLVGLGTIVAGGGAALGTGAFSTVQADRTVTVSPADDQNAFLQFAPGDSYESFVDTSGDTVTIDIGAMEEGDDRGLNNNALSAFDDVLAIGNDGSNSVDLRIDTGDSSGVEFYTGNYSSDSTGVENLTIQPADGTLDMSSDSNGETVKTVGIAVDLRDNSSLEDGGVEVTIIAEEN